MRILITGSSGFLGSRVMMVLDQQGHDPIPCDKREDILNPNGFLSSVKADAAIHLAADKHAPRGEEFPEEVAELNIIGTANVCRAVPKVVLASTCKAAAPITCYGASKLIAERIVLNAGGTVIRLVNVLGSTGSVTRIWDELPEDAPLPVTNCTRLFMEPEEAVRALIHGLKVSPGRYAPNLPDRRWTMIHLAEMRYPGRAKCVMPLRRGDRPVERLANEYERMFSWDAQLIRIADRWEADVQAEAA